MTRIYVLFFVSLERRRVEFVASTTNPDGPWVAQQARNLMMQLGDEGRFRFLLRARDSKFCFDFDAVFRSEGIRIIRDDGGLGPSDSNELNHALRRMLWNRGDYVRPIELVNQHLNART